MTAGDIEPMHDVEIVNPDHVIAHLAAGGKLDMQIKVEQGRGYIAATTPQDGRGRAHAWAASCSTRRSARCGA